MTNLGLHLVLPEQYAAALGAAREQSDRIREMTSSPAEILGGGTADYFLSDDWQSGFAVRESGECVGLFSLVKGRGGDLVMGAVDAGATDLDCFDGYLPKLYSRYGFVEVRREPNWTPGEPDVVYMSRKSN